MCIAREEIVRLSGETLARVVQARELEAPSSMAQCRAGLAGDHTQLGAALETTKAALAEVNADPSLERRLATCEKFSATIKGLRRALCDLSKTGSICEEEALTVGAGNRNGALLLDPACMGVTITDPQP